MMKKFTAYVDFDRLQKEVDLLLEELARVGPDIATWSPGVWHPSVDIYETQHEVVVKVEVPGVRKSDLTVNLKHNILMITGRKLEEFPSENNACFLCLERHYGEFRRLVPLAVLVDPHSGQSSLKDGILTIRLKKIADSRKSEYHIPIAEEPSSD